MLANRSAAPPQSSKRGGVADGSSTSKKRKKLDSDLSTIEFKPIVKETLERHKDVKDLGFYEEVLDSLRDRFNNLYKELKDLKGPRNESTRDRLKKNFTLLLASLISELKEFDAGSKEGDKKRELIKAYEKERGEYEKKSLRDILNGLVKKKENIERKNNAKAISEFRRGWLAYHKHFYEKKAELTKENSPEAEEFKQLLESVGTFYDKKLVPRRLKWGGRREHQGDSAGAPSSQVEAHHPEEFTSEGDQPHDFDMQYYDLSNDDVFEFLEAQEDEEGNYLF